MDFKRKEILMKKWRNLLWVSTNDKGCTEKN
ncbi:hypothetical protein OL548_29240 [Lysinibacillus sp. MHQ-1]|nr:hypothetical protein OL548_29240 [Lysinibacillus sp. MHQ-1]